MLLVEEVRASVSCVFANALLSINISLMVVRFGILSHSIHNNFNTDRITGSIFNSATLYDDSSMIHKRKLSVYFPSL